MHKYYCSNHSYNWHYFMIILIITLNMAAFPLRCRAGIVPHPFAGHWCQIKIYIYSKYLYSTDLHVKFHTMNQSETTCACNSNIVSPMVNHAVLIKKLIGLTKTSENQSVTTISTAEVSSSYHIDQLPASNWSYNRSRYIRCSLVAYLQKHSFKLISSIGYYGKHEQQIVLILQIIIYIYVN